jgi:hypothetical protein
MKFLGKILILVIVLYNKYHLLQPNEEYHDTVENDSKFCYFWSVSMSLIWRELIKRTILAFLLWHMVSKMSLFFKTYACNDRYFDFSLAKWYKYELILSCNSSTFTLVLVYKGHHNDAYQDSYHLSQHMETHSVSYLLSRSAVSSY